MAERDDLERLRRALLDSARRQADDAWLAALLDRLERRDPDPGAFFKPDVNRVYVDALRELVAEPKPTQEQLRFALALLDRLASADAAAMLANELHAEAERDSSDAQERQRGSAEKKRAKREADLDDLARALERLRQRKAVEDWDLDAIRAEANAERRKRKAPELGQSRAKNITHAAIAARADALRK